MKVLVVGSGGREHAVVKSLRKSPRITGLYCAPGNGGISDDAVCVDIKATNIEKMVEYVKKEKIDLVCVTPDDPLYLGMVDAMEKEGIRAFGPCKNAAEIEGSKAFSKDLMKKYNIPTAGYEVFADPAKALEYLEKQKMPIVLKADGLALGKGVLICETLEDARSGIDDIMIKKKFGSAGDRVVIEEFIVGSEVSILAFCDGKTIKLMPSSQDHKRAFDGDKGLNTGGMGTFTPSRVYDEEIRNFCIGKVFQPTVDAMQKENRAFKGVLYFGLMITSDGPKVLEYNARFGDPETQVILPLLKTDLLDIFEACIDGTLDKLDILWSDEAVVCVVLTSGGYPEKYIKGYEITGTKGISDDVKLFIFHAGTLKKDEKYYTNGGRVLGVTAKADSINDARKKAYDITEKICFTDKFFRKDIGIK